MSREPFKYRGCLIRINNVSEPECGRESVEQLIGGQWIEVVTASLDWSEEFTAYLASHNQPIKNNHHA